MRLAGITVIDRVCAALFLALIAIGACEVPAAAQDLKIRSPIIEPQELEFENNFKFGGGKNAVSEFEYGFTDWLKLGVEQELEGDPGHGFHYDSTALEGFLQLTPQGKYWADLGLFAEYENTVRTGDPRGLMLGPLIEKEVRLFGFDTLHTGNLLFTKQLGGGSVGPLNLLAAENSRIRLDPHFEPGVEYYGIVTLGAHGDEPTHRFGPALAGRVGFRELGIATPGGIKYDAAYLLGLTKETNPSTIRFRVEFEFPL